MKRANPESIWVIQGWNKNPRAELLAGVPRGDIVVLDLASEIKPNWGDPDLPSPYKREGGYIAMFSLAMGSAGSCGTFSGSIGVPFFHIR